MNDILPYESTHSQLWLRSKKMLKSKIHILPIYEQMNPKTAILIVSLLFYSKIRMYSSFFLNFHFRCIFFSSWHAQSFGWRRKEKAIFLVHWAWAIFYCYAYGSFDSIYFHQMVARDFWCSPSHTINGRWKVFI